MRALVEHLVGWLQVFDAAERFGASARSPVQGWQTLGTDRTVRLTSGEVPAPMAFDITLMEYLTHGWDLATALGRPAPFSDSEAEATLARARATLQPQYRGPGTAMGEPVAVPDDAPALTRLVAFMGRRP